MTYTLSCDDAQAHQTQAKGSVVQKTQNMRIPVFKFNMTWPLRWQQKSFVATMPAIATSLCDQSFTVPVHQRHMISCHDPDSGLQYRNCLSLHGTLARKDVDMCIYQHANFVLQKVWWYRRHWTPKHFHTEKLQDSQAFSPRIKTLRVTLTLMTAAWNIFARWPLW